MWSTKIIPRLEPSSQYLTLCSTFVLDWVARNYHAAKFGYFRTKFEKRCSLKSNRRFEIEKVPSWNFVWIEIRISKP